MMMPWILYRGQSALLLLLGVAGMAACGGGESTTEPAPAAPPAATAPAGTPAALIPTPADDAPAASAPVAAAQASPAPANSREGWPTEEEAKEAIFRVEHAIHASQTNKDVWHVEDMRHEVQSVRFAERTTQKQMDYGAQAITVYPARIHYTRITTYRDKPETREELGDNGVWFLYQDSFGDWTGKFGTE
ncbi:MAG TPA: hypothetical protein PLS90_17015 [Candidatus Sumerlaeota bacterium]|nr:hypothetical protein [Candidatus Sumerlaeota bacterium]